MLCAVCLDAPARRGGGGFGIYTCPPGCRGRHVVCDACDRRLRACVYCRSRIVLGGGSAGEDEGGDPIATLAFCVLVLGWAIFLVSMALMGGRPPAREAAEAAAAEDVDALD